MGGFEVLGEGPGGTRREYLPASDDHPPPIRLDLDPSDDDAGATEPMRDGSGDRGDPPRPWQHWVALGLAVVVGLAIGVFVRGANQSAADGARADLTAAGPVFDLAGPVRGEVANVVRFSFLNNGPLDVDILDVRLAGWVAVDGVESPYPVRAAPDVWTVVPVTLTPECTTRPGPTLRLRVRTGAGEQSVAIRLPPGHEDALWLWEHGCENPLTADGVAIVFREVISQTDDALRIRADVQVGGGVSTADITAVESDTPGLTAQATGLPVTLTSDLRSAPIELTWSVTDCARAESIVDAALGVNVVGPETDAVDTRIQVPVDVALIIELARLSVRACET